MTVFFGCQEEVKSPRNSTVDEITNNEDLKGFINSSNSASIMLDSSQNISPAEELKKFDIADDLKLDLVLAEPQIHRPLDIKFDHRGRLWEVQYNQDPYPEGVKVVDLDRHNRAVFNKPHSEGVKGAIKIRDLFAYIQN